MAFSVHQYEGDGSTTQYAINFTLDYLAEEHVICEVEGEVDGGGNPIPRTLSFITTNLVDVGDAPANGLEIIIRRETPKTALWHDYQDGAGIIELNLDESNLQNLMIAHEVLDGYSTTRAIDLDMNEFNITGMADPVNAQDGATKAYVDLISAQDQVDLATAQAVIAASEASDAAISATTAESAALAIPAISSGDSYKALQVNASETGYETVTSLRINIHATDGTPVFLSGTDGSDATLTSNLIGDTFASNGKFSFMNL